MTRILFTGVGRRVELVQSFREAAIALDEGLCVYGADVDHTAPALAYCDHQLETPPMADARYIQSLLDVCSRESIDLVIPTIDTDLAVLACARHRFLELGTRVLVCSPQLVRACEDKVQTAELFLGCELCAPLCVSDWREYDSGFPAFIKPRCGSASVGARVVQSPAELELLAARIGEYVVQPLVEGVEYTVDVLCDWDGSLLSAVPRERLLVRAGEVSKACVRMDDAIISAVERLCSSIRPCGPISVQLIRDGQGTDWFTEINPRFGGGAPLSMRAGSRAAEMVLGLLTGERVERWDCVADGATFSRFDQSVQIVGPLGPVCGVVFDLDDTLYPEREYVRSGFRAVSEYLCGDYNDALWGYFEQGLPAIDELLSALGRPDEGEAVLRVYRGHMPQIRLRDGARELLCRLRERGVRVGIVTDGRPKGQRNKVEALGLGSLVDDVIITDELGGPQFRKPCDIALRIMQRRWGLPASQMVYVGDNPAKDFQAPWQLGMGCVMLASGDGLYQSAGEGLPSVAVVHDFAELGRVLLP